MLESYSIIPTLGFHLPLFLVCIAFDNVSFDKGFIVIYQICPYVDSFEYYMMHFLYHLVNPNLQKYATTSCGSDSVYFAIFEDYLQYFLPCNGCDPEMIPVPSQVSSYGSAGYATPTKQR